MIWKFNSRGDVLDMNPSHLTLKHRVHRCRRHIQRCDKIMVNSQAKRGDLSATSVGNVAIFAGGWSRALPHLLPLFFA